jgi:hypothetical protein
MKNGELVKTIQFGTVRIYIWENYAQKDGKVLKIPAFHVKRIYFVGGQKKAAAHFRPQDLENLSEAIQEAIEYMQQRDDAVETEEDDQEDTG